MDLLPITHCPFCGNELTMDDRCLIQTRLGERDEEGNYLYPIFRIICTHCDAEVRLIRQTTYGTDAED